MSHPSTLQSCASPARPGTPTRDPDQRRHQSSTTPYLITHEPRAQLTRGASHSSSLDNARAAQIRPRFLLSSFCLVLEISLSLRWIAWVDPSAALPSLVAVSLRFFVLDEDIYNLPHLYPFSIANILRPASSCLPHHAALCVPPTDLRSAAQHTLPTSIMTSVFQLTNFASFLLAQLPFLPTSPQLPSQYSSDFSSSTILTNAPTCPVDSPLSCHNSTVAPDSCCFVYPGGQLLSTQFWDTHPAIGPQDSWTLHGLWPDLCDGSYPTYCTSAPTYHNISAIISASSNPAAPALLSFMNTYWLPNRGTAEHFWEHEWNKHGTCVNTLAPSCYTSSSSSSSSPSSTSTYTAGDEVVDFFARAVDVFKGLDTYQALGAAGIWPSFYERHTAREIEEALTAVTGSAVVLGCRRGELNEVWYSFNVRGSLQTGTFVPTRPVGKGGRGTCPAKGIKYLPKGRR